MLSLIKARTSMVLGQYSDVIKYFKAYMDEEPFVPLSRDELRLLADAYSHLSDEKRVSIWRLEEYLQSLDDSHGECIVAVSSLLEETRNDMIAICNDVVDVVDGNLLKNVEEIREKVFMYKIKGDYCRYKWETNFNVATGIEATDAYYEAFSMCQWNFEPTDTYLLEVAESYALHLSHMNSVDSAIAVLKKVIDNALDDMENNDLPNKSFVESILAELTIHLGRLQVLAERRVLQFVELFDEPEIDDRFPRIEDSFFQIVEFDEIMLDKASSRRRD